MFHDLLRFAIAAAGFGHVQHFVGQWNESYIDALSKHLRLWQYNRRTDDFYRHIFEANGYSCKEVKPAKSSCRFTNSGIPSSQFFKSCYYGGNRVACCTKFYSTYVALRGRCFRMRRVFQEHHGVQGIFRAEMNQLPSPLLGESGVQVTFHLPSFRMITLGSRCRLRIGQLRGCSLVPTILRESSLPHGHVIRRRPVQHVVEAELLSRHNESACAMHY